MRRLSGPLLVMGGLLGVAPVAAHAQAYNPITPTKANTTITLTGKDMTVQDVVDIARHGARVEVSRQHRRATAANLQLVLEGARQGVPIYGFNRGGGAERELVLFEGDPLSPENAPALVNSRYNGFRFVGVHGGGEQHSGLGPEVADEEIVRAQMAVTLNRMRYAGMNPALVDLLAEFLNRRITPVVLSRGTDGGGDLSQDGSVRAAMVGVGEVHLRGQRMSARQALAMSGLTPLQKTVDSIGVYAGWGGHNSYTDGQAALLAHDAKEMLDWGDLVFAMSMLGLNSSISPITAVPQRARQFPYVNWQAKRLLNILRGSYLFDLEADPNDPDNTHGQRLLQDPLSYRDYTQRNGAVWEAYVRLKKNLQIQINSNSSNPVIMPGVHPDDSWELNTPWVKRYYIEPADETEGGFVLGSANFDNTPLNNSMEQFTLALAQSYVGTLERTQRTFDPFFTVVRTTGSRGLLEGFPESAQCNVPHADAFAMSDILGELKSLANPVPAEGNWTERGIQDVQGLGRQKVAKARLAVDNGMYLLSQELLSATKWMDHRRVQSPVRSFGAAPTAAWQAWRVLSPCQQDPEERDLMETWRINLPYAFLKGNSASRFLGPNATEPVAKQVSYRTKRVLKKARSRRATLRRHANEPVTRARARASMSG